MTDAVTDLDGFTRHYLQELEALRREAHDFAERYPKIAARLSLETTGNPDPHVERLIEAFAFLAARIQRKLDDDFPELSDALLEVLYPHLTRPIPSMTVAELTLDQKQSVPATGVRLARGSPFVSKPMRGEPLRFRSTAPVTIWPVRVAEAVVEPLGARAMRAFPDARSMLRLRLECTGAAPLGEFEMDRLRFFLRGEPRVVHDLYELLGSALAGIVVETTADAREARHFERPADALRPLGFDEEEASLPYPRRSFGGYRLLQEYFAFPEKFHFLELTGLEALRGTTARELDLRFALRREPTVSHADIVPENFSLSAVPLINLFERTAEPIVLSPHVAEHYVVPDRSRPMDYEVYSVLEVTGLAAGTGETIPYRPFYSVQHDTPPGSAGAYWHALRRASRRKGDDGTEVAVALVDLDLQRLLRDGETLHVKLLCSNRDLPHQSGQWGRDDDLKAEGVTEIQGVRCLVRPTRTLRPRLSGTGHWKLVSQLSLNYLSIVAEGGEALREILRVYDFAATPANREQIEGLVEVRSEPAVRWVRNEYGAGFAQGTHTTLVLDRDRFVGASALLLASVLERFLALYCSLNSFSELSLETPQDQREIHRWSPRAGERILL